MDGYNPEEIQAVYPELSLEKIYATITYYLHNRVKVDDYLRRIQAWQETRYQESLQHPSVPGEKIRKIKQQRQRLTKV